MEEGLVLSLTLLLGVACNPGGACVRAGSFTEGATNNSVGGDLTRDECLLSTPSEAAFPMTTKINQYGPKQVANTVPRLLYGANINTMIILTELWFNILCCITRIVALGYIITICIVFNEGKLGLVFIAT